MLLPYVKIKLARGEHRRLCRLHYVCSGPILKTLSQAIDLNMWLKESRNLKILFLHLRGKMELKLVRHNWKVSSSLSNRVT